MPQARTANSRKPPKDSSQNRDVKRDKRNPGAVPRRKDKDYERPQRQPAQKTPAHSDETNRNNRNQIEIAETIPVSLQQLLLNVFGAALLTSSPTGSSAPTSAPTETELDIKSLIQTIKSHLYNRDFDSAFTDADEGLLRAYALRWSAARALGYAGLFKSLMKGIMDDRAMGKNQNQNQNQNQSKSHVVCIGGGAGAEIVALAAAWRDLMNESAQHQKPTDLLDAVTQAPGASKGEGEGEPRRYPDLSITAVDIADWSTVVNRLSSTILSPRVPGSKAHRAPLLPDTTRADGNPAGFSVDFQRLDVLSLPDEKLGELFFHFNAADADNNPNSLPTSTVMVTLMFTLNELFSTSMAKATSFLLRTTDHLRPGTLLLVVDSPGSYSTLKLGKTQQEGGSGVQERQYPMKFLLDHTLLSVATGKWERLFSQDSRWWRRDAAKLWYDVGEGAGLEDMRFQIHVYRRL
ncbi:hypothetical protein P175DRAFT_0474995 [Aspergillus ochraceoroseus IBT 24754]|uniref:25S rRNA (Uridine(2843)-N(3))-methyltransferase n=1 Tax=Aspergillus ochraceoroseus IBT 24754 TaxID=1392256 RepID=A0A2T5M3J4_9EURO|nr:uncharacterized protein P175DRAFT_0474995 [Aspergillus ochraceoroseus IBT 24754]PTU23103.1 hypothetical protein P175DRAFT_0474995 [Aspergillus ochraceoroseus IBT 24754]